MAFWVCIIITLIVGCSIFTSDMKGALNVSNYYQLGSMSFLTEVIRIVHVYGSSPIELRCECCKLYRPYYRITSRIR
jgi:hypothetical protein